MGDDVRPLPDTRVPDTQEFFENQSQTNALNSKRTFDEFQDLSLVAARRSQENQDFLNVISRQAVQNAVVTQDMLAKLTLTGIQDGMTLSDQNLNPEAQATGQTLAASGYPPNRAIDTATAGVAAGTSVDVNAVLAQVVAALGEAIAAINRVVTSPTK